jgi:hypothetical protein
MNGAGFMGLKLKAEAVLVNNHSTFPVFQFLSNFLGREKSHQR